MPHTSMMICINRITVIISKMQAEYENCVQHSCDGDVEADDSDSQTRIKPRNHAIRMMKTCYLRSVLGMS